MGKQADPASGLMTIFHGEKLVVVDREGSIRGFYDADEEGMRDLMREVEALAKAK
jgi:protein SCO1/2